MYSFKFYDSSGILMKMTKISFDFVLFKNVFEACFQRNEIIQESLKGLEIKIEIKVHLWLCAH